MLSVGLVCTVLSSLGWAGFDVTRKQMVEHANTASLVVLINVVQVPGFLAWAAIEGQLELGVGYLGWFWGSLLLNSAAHLWFLRSVQLSPLSATVPLLGVTPVFTAMIGMVWEAEAMTLGEWLAIAAVVLGAFVLNATVADLTHPWRLVGTILRERGSLYMVLVALLWSLTPFFDRRALEHATVGVHGALLSAGVALVVGFWARMNGPIHLLALGTQVRLPLALSGIFALIGFGFQLVAIQYLRISLFEGLKRGLGMILSVVSGRFFFGERISPPKLLAVALMSAGVLWLV